MSKLLASFGTFCRVASLTMVTMVTHVSHAEDRMPPIAESKLSGQQQAAIAAFRTQRGKEVSGPFIALLRSPELMTRTRAMGDYLRFKSSLPPQLSEFLILVVARHWTQEYEWYVHAPIAVKSGVDASVVQALQNGTRPRMMSREQALLYELSEELHTARTVSDATYARAVAQFGEQGTIDAVGIIGYYTLLAMVMNTTRTPLPGGAQPALQPQRVRNE